MLWGLYYAVLLILEKLFLGRLLGRLPAAVGHAYTLLAAVTGWMLFAIEDLSRLRAYLAAMFTGWTAATAAETALVSAYLPLLAAAVFASLPAGKQLFSRLPQRGARALAAVLSVLALLLCTAALAGDSYNPFLYFRF